jgi:hypothetical protein
MSTDPEFVDAVEAFEELGGWFIRASCLFLVHEVDCILVAPSTMLALHHHHLPLLELLVEAHLLPLHFLLLYFNLRLPGLII